MSFGHDLFMKIMKRILQDGFVDTFLFQFALLSKSLELIKFSILNVSAVSKYNRGFNPSENTFFGMNTSTLSLKKKGLWFELAIHEGHAN